MSHCVAKVEDVAQTRVSLILVNDIGLEPDCFMNYVVELIRRKKPRAATERTGKIGNKASIKSFV